MISGLRCATTFRAVMLGVKSEVEPDDGRLEESGGVVFTSYLARCCGTKHSSCGAAAGSESNHVEKITRPHLRM